MSIASMVDTHLVSVKGASDQVSSPTSPQGVPTNILNQITRWIPTETIAIYVALLPLLASTASGSSYTSRWVLFGIVTAANPLVVLLLVLAKSTIKESWWKAVSPPPFFAIVASTVAFAAWAFALPDTPLKDLSGYDTKWNVAIITVVTIAITLIANAFHQSPDFDQVQTQVQGANAGPAN